MSTTTKTNILLHLGIGLRDGDKLADEQLISFEEAF
jgi:hypothetical protein